MGGKSKMNSKSVDDWLVEYVRRGVGDLAKCRESGAEVR